MRSLAVLLVALVLTPVFAARLFLAVLRQEPDGPGSVYDRLPRTWARAVLRAAGARVVVHGAGNLAPGAPRIYASNHVSWFDVFALALVLPRYKFIAKSELRRIPIFGPAAHAAVMIPIDRENRKAAFRSYDEAADRIRAGDSVVVFPEGTRGRSYALRPFKKGPFVLAVTAGVPIVPVVVHGTIEIMPKGSFRVRRGRIDVHVLDPVSTHGLGFADRDVLVRLTWERMANAMRERYGIESPPPGARPAGNVVAPAL